MQLNVNMFKSNTLKYTMLILSQQCRLLGHFQLKAHGTLTEDSVFIIAIFISFFDEFVQNNLPIRILPAFSKVSEEVASWSSG